MVQPQPTRAEVLAKMDIAAEDAKKELSQLIDDTAESQLTSEAVSSIASWWRRWYPRAGHKRLGRILMSGGK